jgi:hypothetical protein
MSQVSSWGAHVPVGRAGREYRALHGIEADIRAAQRPGMRSPGDTPCRFDEIAYMVGSRPLIQLVISAITTSLPKSLSRSCAWPSYSFSVLSGEPAVS